LKKNERHVYKTRHKVRFYATLPSTVRKIAVFAPPYAQVIHILLIVSTCLLLRYSFRSRKVLFFLFPKIHLSLVKKGALRL